VAGLPFDLPPHLAERLRAALDVEGKLPRAVVDLLPPGTRDVALVDVPDGPLVAGLGDLHCLALPAAKGASPARLGLPDTSVDAVIGAWSAFRGVDVAALDEVDRVLRPAGRLLVVHDYGRDDVAALRPPDAPEYESWSRRSGPFLRSGFRVHVVHCFWTFASVDDGRTFLGEAFGPPGEALGRRLRRPRVAWNVAIYHRERGAGGDDVG
jgi:SAM-dependent methyltransferase